MLISRNFSAFIFDFDGTLIDTAPDIIGVLNAVLKDRGYPLLAMDRTLIGPPLEDIIAGALPPLSPQEQASVKTEYRARYREHHYGSSRIFSGIVPLLHRLREKNIPAFVATNKPEAVSRRFLALKNIDGFFKDVISRDSLPGKALSKAEMLEQLAYRYGLDLANCLMIGDSVFDMQGGRLAGLKTAAIMYGYGKHEDLLAEHPDFIVADEGWSDIRPWMPSTKKEPL